MTKQHTNSGIGAQGAAHAQAAAEINEQHQADESVIAEASVAVGEGAGPQGDESTPSYVDATADAAGAATQEATPEQVSAQLQSDLEAEKAHNADLLDKFQRSAAEFQNSRRRQEKQTADAIDRASAQIVRKLLPVLDDFDLAFERMPATLANDQPAWVDGFRQIQRKLVAILEEEGVKQIPSDGAFDPTHHEAVSSEPNESVASGNIISTLRVGYEQRGHILRPSLVRVAA